MNRSILRSLAAGSGKLTKSRCRLAHVQSSRKPRFRNLTPIFAMRRMLLLTVMRCLPVLTKLAFQSFETLARDTLISNSKPRLPFSGLQILFPSGLNMKHSDPSCQVKAGNFFIENHEASDLSRFSQSLS